jgi:elongation factor P hydroxylase
MTLTGNLTCLLKLEYIKAGWRLSEDEDFVYLYPPDSREAYVFNAREATIEEVEAIIRSKRD